MGELQYNAWMRREPVRRSGWEPTYPKKNEGVDLHERILDDDNRGPKVQTSRYKAVGTDKRMSDVQNLGEKKLGSTTQTSEVRDKGNKDYQEKVLDILVKEGVDETQTNTGIEGCGQGTMETYQTETPMFKFESASKGYEEGGHVGLDLTKDREGLIAMTYDMELGWVTEALGPTSEHWKRKACED